MTDLFGDFNGYSPTPLNFAEGAVLLRQRVSEHAQALLAAIKDITQKSPLRAYQTPGRGQMSAKMSGCGQACWVSDLDGYRYQTLDPRTQQPWPPMPAWLSRLAHDLASEAGYEDFYPDVCLINQYDTGAKMGLHQDQDEVSFDHPIVSISLGAPAIFQFGGPTRSSPVQRLALIHGDAVVWGGPSRLHYHGILALKPAHHPLTGPYRYNLTFRRALS